MQYAVYQLQYENSVPIEIQIILEISIDIDNHHLNASVVQIFYDGRVVR